MGNQKDKNPISFRLKMPKLEQQNIIEEQFCSWKKEKTFPAHMNEIIYAHFFENKDIKDNIDNMDSGELLELLIHIMNLFQKMDKHEWALKMINQFFSAQIDTAASSEDVLVLKNENKNLEDNREYMLKQIEQLNRDKENLQRELESEKSKKEVPKSHDFDLELSKNKGFENADKKPHSPFHHTEKRTIGQDEENTSQEELKINEQSKKQNKERESVIQFNHDTGYDTWKFDDDEEEPEINKHGKRKLGIGGVK